ncbi:MAG TPA: hypothetical protein VLT62_08475 [Candidatus Methylomirabilis sp.]|nr:hypothetical protein [Candidatus Methylomirabilis sp.]
MKRLFLASVMGVVLAASAAVAAELPSTTQPVKGTEGPDIRYAAVQPVRGIEGPDIRRSKDDQSSQPVKGAEGPDIR